MTAWSWTGHPSPRTELVTNSAKNKENSRKALRSWYRIILLLVTGEGPVKGREGTLRKKRNGMDVLADN